MENWVCQDCNNKVSSFGCIFDSLKGKVRTFMKVVYENDFLEDFQNANGQAESDEDGDGGEGLRKSNEGGGAGSSEAVNENAAVLSSNGGGGG